MKTIALIILLSSSKLFAYGPIYNLAQSTFFEVTTPKTHLLDKKDNSFILRGATPRDEFDLKSLINFGIKKFIIVKKEVKTEVQEETNDLLKLGIPKEDIIYIPLKWTNFFSFSDQCKMTVQVLQQIENSLLNNESLYFHCTVGEDRTGMIAALWKSWRNENLEFGDLFDNQMCQHGYEASNPNKPLNGVLQIRSYLTTFYIQMFQFLKDKKMQNFPLDQIKCPENIPFIPNNNQNLVCRQEKN